MNCPVCRKTPLGLRELGEGLKAMECRLCGGKWIQSFQYWKWRELHGRSLPERPPGEVAELDVANNTEAKLCPECGHFLRRYPVGHGIAFTLDRCGHCGGMWFDRNEWKILKGRNLHDDVHLIFSTVWQAQLNHEERVRAKEELLVGMFGKQEYERLREIRRWINGHPLAHQLRAFLLDDDARPSRQVFGKPRTTGGASTPSVE
jgi:Zn-finger nucleic acid-binding protein